jgi:hypothetical protein
MRPLVFATFLAFGTPLAADLGPLEPLADLHRAVHEELGLPEPLIVRLLENGLPDDELPVVGFLSQRSGWAPDRIVELHRGGLSYFEISRRAGLGPEIFYVPIAVDPGPPYGKAWGYYKKTPRARWNAIVLPDADVVNLVNLRLAVDHYRVAPERVIELRRGGRGFAAIHGELRGPGRRGGPAAAAGPGKSPGSGKAAKPGGSGKGKGKGQGEGKGKGPKKGHG